MSQKGFAHLLLILVLLAGIVVGVYLITSGNPLKLFSKAFDTDSIELLTNQLINLNSGRTAQDASQVSQMASIAFKRQNKLLEEAQSDPQAFLNNAKLTAQRDSFPKEVQQYLEEDKETSGVLLIIHQDDFEAKKSINSYFIRVDKEYTTLHFVDPPANSLAGKQIKASGISLGSEMVLKDDSQLTVNRSAQDITLPTTGSQKVAVLMVYFGSEAPGISASELRNKWNDSFFSVKNYYLENSYGQLSVSADIYDNIVISGDYSNCNLGGHDDGKNLFSWTIRADQAARSQGIPMESYQRTAYIFPRMDNCYFGGMATYSGESIYWNPSTTWWNPSRMWIFKGHDSANLYEHEFGHNLGVDHSNLLKCGNSQIDVPSKCQSKEYYDTFDVMGFVQSISPHFNAPHKIEVGWVPANRITTVTQSGTYTISLPIERGGESLQVIKVPKADTQDYYYLEYRRPTGFDQSFSGSVVEGILIHEWSGKEFNFYRGTRGQTQLIDNTPQSEGIEDAALSDGWHFYDPINKILIRQLKHDAKSVTVEVKFNVAETPPQPTPRPSPTPTPQQYIYRLINDRSGIISKYLCSLDPTQPMGARLSINSCQQIGLPYRNLGLQYTSEYVARSEGQDYLMRLIYYSDGRYQERRCLLGANTLTTKDLDSCELHRELNIGTNLQYTSEYIVPYSGKNYLFRLIYNKDGSYEERRCRLDENNPMGVSFNDCEQVRSLNIGQGLQYTSEYVAKYEGQDYLFRLVYNKNGDYTEYRCPLDSENPMGAKIQNVATQCTKIRSLNIGTNLQHTSEFVAP